MSTTSLDPLRHHPTRPREEAIDPAIGLLAPLLEIDLPSPEADEIRQLLIKTADFDSVAALITHRNTGSVPAA